LQGRFFELDREWKVPALNQVAVNVNRNNIPSANLNPPAAPVLQLCANFSFRDSACSNSTFFGHFCMVRINYTLLPIV
jgi:5'-nucleotidase